jgi:two-component system, OmpR family, sensor histidine kinase KdpD
MAQPPDPAPATLRGETQEGQPATDEAHQVTTLECAPVPGDAEAPPECRYRTRGRHKIFLGYAAGVGKTYTMLSEAHRRMERGEDVVVGYVEPHGRPATQVLLDGLEQVPVKLFEYRGTTLTEMDTAAVLRRRPQVVLVDELAHTNAPGAEHAKRWQSVLDIVAAGIGVMSTVNVQHFESVNDTVFEITGVRPQETLPDSILRDADEVVLVDLTVNALLNRLQRGVIYAPDKVPRALEHFFREGNLLALRELALRTTAERVDESLDEYVEDHKIKDPWHTEDRVLVCVPASPLAKTLVRRGHRLARRFQGGFWTVFVRVPGVRLKPEEEAQLQEAFALSRDLGGKVLEVDGESAAREIIRLAGEHRATHLIVGQSRRSRFKDLTGSSVVSELLRASHGVDVLVIADPDHK